VKEASRQFPTLQVVFMDGAYRGEIKARIEKETGIEVKITLRSDAQKKVSSQLPFDGLWSERSVG
jgi:hypothetical protein